MQIAECRINKHPKRDQRKRRSKLNPRGWVGATSSKAGYGPQDGDDPKHPRAFGEEPT